MQFKVLSLILSKADIYHSRVHTLSNIITLGKLKPSYQLWSREKIEIRFISIPSIKNRFSIRVRYLIQ